MKKIYLTFPVYFSPIILLVVLEDTLVHNAYPADGDTIAIPLFNYIIFLYPIASIFAYLIKSKTLGKPVIKWWNKKRNLLSLLSFVLSIYPLGLMWISFLQISFSCGAYGSLVVCLLMTFITGAVRTYSIQDIK